MERNRQANSFRERAVKEFLGRTIEPLRVARGVEVWHVFTFKTRRLTTNHVSVSKRIQLPLSLTVFRHP